MPIHYLMCPPDQFKEAIEANRSFDIRLNDRNYKKGDVLVYLEDLNWSDFNTAKRKASRLIRHVTCVFTSFEGLLPDYVAMTIKPMPDR